MGEENEMAAFNEEEIMISNLSGLKTLEDKLAMQAHFRDIQRRSINRKELIEKGLLKYVKNVGLVNIETGEVLKLW